VKARISFPRQFTHSDLPYPLRLTRGLNRLEYLSGITNRKPHRLDIFHSERHQRELNVRNDEINPLRELYPLALALERARKNDPIARPKTPYFHFLELLELSDESHVLVPSFHRNLLNASRERFCLAPNCRSRVCARASRDDPSRSHRTRTFLNCQGSDVSMSSGNRPGRSVSGVQSV
jgi:hypothetical protein